MDYDYINIPSVRLGNNMRPETKVNILLVDDQPKHLLALEAILERLGQNLVKAYSGEEALRCLLQEEFALILLNVHMPGMDGLETARRIRERPAVRHTPIIFITEGDRTKRSTLKGKRSDTDALRGYSLGAVDYLFEPIAPEILLSKVSVFISMFQQTQEVKQQATQLEARHQALKRELAEYKQVEAACQQANEQLEIKVAERTAALQQANDDLVAEIVDRRQLEIALRKSESLYRTLVETIPHGIEEIDATGIITFCNCARQRMLGLDEEQLLGKPIWDLCPASERATLPEYLVTLVQEQPPPTPYLGKNLTKQGNVIDVQVDWNYKRDERGRVTGFICAIADITERKRAEQQLHFQARLLDAVEQSVIVTDLESNIVYWNRYAEVLYGWSPAEVLGRPIVDVIPADTTKEQAPEFMSHLPMGKSQSQEFWVKRRDGKIFPAMLSNSPIYDDQGRLSGIIGVSLDISARKQAQLALQELNQQLEHRVQQRTAELQQANQRLQAEVRERRQVEEALRASEARYKAIVENSYDIITLTDEQDNIYHQNSATERILGYSLEESSGKQPVHRIHPEDIPKVQAAMSDILAQPGVPVTVEYRMQRADGSWAWLESVGTNWLGNPDIKAIVANSRDISDVYDELRLRKQAQEALRQQVERERLIAASIQRIRETLDLDVILNTTVEEVRQFLQVDRVLVYKIWPDGTGSTIAEAVVPGCARILGQTFPEEIFPQEFHQLYRQGRVRAIVNPETDDVAPCLVKFLQEWGVKSKLVVAILRQGELWGLLIAHHCCQSRQWQPLETDLLEQLAIQLAIAIQQADLYQQVQGELAERKQAQEELRQARDELEIRVQQRTAQLIQINCSLEAEIRDRIAAEEALRTSEERFRVTLKNSPTTVFHQDADLHYIWLYNPMSGFSSEQAIGKLDCELFAPEDAQRLAAIKRRVLTTGVGTREETFITINGDVRYYDLTVEPLFGSAGEITGITCAAMDITEIRARERLLRAIFESSLDAIAILDDEGRYVEANPAACQLFGLPLLELLGKPIADFVEPCFNFEGMWRSLVELGQGTGELRLQRSDGTVRDVEYAAKASFLPGQHLAVLRDITERKQAEEMRRALEAEKELRRLQLRFFSMISHEFRTPLSTILGSAQLLKSCTQAWTEEKKLRNLVRIETAAKNMTQLLDDLLTINRAESGKLECNPKPIHLEKFCRRLVEELQLHADPKHQITYSIQGQCPTVSLDEKLIRSILTNLLTNALKYSPQGGKIHLALICQEEEAIFQIQDQGIGIPREDQTHLFELFHRGKNVANIPGTGLGLSVVKKCLDLHDGKIAIESEVGVGTTVTTTIPLGSTS